MALLLSPGNKKIKSLAELKKIAVLAENDNSIALRPQLLRRSF